MSLPKEIAKIYRPAKGVTESFVHNVFGQVSLSTLKLDQAEFMAKQGLLIKKKKSK